MILLAALCFGWRTTADGAAGERRNLAERMDALWQARADIGAVLRLIESGEEEIARNADDFDAAWRVARAYWWLTMRQDDRTLKKALAVKGMEWGRKATELDRARVEGHYFYASTIGLYGTTIGMMKAMVEGVAGKFEEAMSRSYEIDRDYDRGGPTIALGRYLYMLPWPKRDLKRSRRYLEEARKRHPDRLVARLYLADTYYELGEKKMARAELERVLASAVAPEDVIDRPHELARQRLREWFDSVS